MSNHVPRLERGFNRHHVLWAARSYRSNLEREIRGHEGLIVPTNIHAHAELHYDMPPPRKPNHEQIRHALGALSLWTPERGRLSAVELVRDDFYDMCLSENPDLSYKALQIANHLHNQLGYMQEAPKWRMTNR